MKKDGTGKKKASGKHKAYPCKQHMNLYYKPDRTTMPATVSLYVLFVLVLMLGFSKFMIYDILIRHQDLENQLALKERQLENVQEQLSDYKKVRETYERYSATEEEESHIDCIEILDLLDKAVWTDADISSISIKGKNAVIKFSGVNLAQTSAIVSLPEKNPSVVKITVDTASSTVSGGEDISASMLLELTKKTDEEEDKTEEEPQ